VYLSGWCAAPPTSSFKEATRHLWGYLSPAGSLQWKKAASSIQSHPLPVPHKVSSLAPSSQHTAGLKDPSAPEHPGGAWHLIAPLPQTSLSLILPQMGMWRTILVSSSESFRGTWNTAPLHPLHEDPKQQDFNCLSFAFASILLLQSYKPQADLSLVLSK
jgi:hypothetical protein